jgi:hypothetical protein
MNNKKNEVITLARILYTFCIMLYTLVYSSNGGVKWRILQKYLSVEDRRQ